MAYKTILVHCDASPKVGQRLTVAAELAERYGAHLVGLHARPPLEAPIFFEGGGGLYGRYWGSATPEDSLHFEACYYQGIEYCLSEGLSRFEPGAQGEHKLARGFLPTVVRSRHWMADADFSEALREWCAHERADITRYRDELLLHSPFRSG